MSQPPIEIVLQPTRGFRFVNFRDLYAYRDLLWLLVWRDFVTRYKQTILGPLWHIFQPLLTSGIFTIIFGIIAGLPTNDGLPHTLFYLSGLLPWSYFSQSFTSTSATLVANAGLFGKVYFPRLIVPIASVIAHLTSFFIQLATFFIVFFIYRWSHPDMTAGPRWDAIIFIPLVIAQVAVFSLGVGLWLSALSAKFRDFVVLSSFIIQLWMYLTPVLLPLAAVPEKWKIYYALNPVSMPVELFRYFLLGSAYVTPKLLCASIGATLFTVVTGIFVFQRAEKNFVDVA